MIPYARHSIDEADIDAVVQVLRSGWLTTGPGVDAFEQCLCQFTGAKHAVALSSGTAALHAAMFALDIGHGDEVIVPAMTFVATSNAVLYQGGKPVFADIDPETLLLDPQSVEKLITPRTKAIIGVDYAGQCCNWQSLRQLATKHGLALVADACHALGAQDSRGILAGCLADISVLSFHPAKHITTCEGGMALTDSAHLEQKLRQFRGHGISSTVRQREEQGQWAYAMETLGYNYRISDVQCALGVSQMNKLPRWLARRKELAALYHAALKTIAQVRPLAVQPKGEHAWHLFVVRLPQRDDVFKALRTKGIGANVHYIPVYLHPYYQRLGYGAGICPAAEAAYQEILTLPLWPGMQDGDVDFIVKELAQVFL